MLNGKFRLNSCAVYWILIVSSELLLRVHFRVFSWCYWINKSCGFEIGIGSVSWSFFLLLVNTCWAKSKESFFDFGWLKIFFEQKLFEFFIRVFRESFCAFSCIHIAFASICFSVAFLVYFSNSSLNQQNFNKYTIDFHLY